MAHDALDRITSKVETFSGTTRTYAYAYDSRGRLAQVAVNGAAPVTYIYDANGNRLSRNSESGVYDAQDRVVRLGNATFSWSPNGYLTARSDGGRTTYAYDADGTLTGLTLPDGRRIEYVIDPGGQRIGKKVGGALREGWLWDGDFLVAELDANSALTKHFVYAEDTGAPSFYLTDTNAFRLLSDERGSVRFVVDAQTGSVLAAIDYDEFGRVLSDSEPGLQPFGFAGGHYDPDTGLVRFGQRDYSAETGTWTARDPIGFNGGQYNLYAYLNGDPVNNTDPLGTGPFGFLDRNRQRATDAAFDTTPGSNQRFENALDKYDRSVKAAVLTGQVLVTTGDMVNRVTWAMAGVRASGSSLTSSSSRLESSTGRSTLSSNGRAPIGRIMAPRGGGPGVGGAPAPEPPPPPAPNPVPLDQSSLLLNFL